MSASEDCTVHIYDLRTLKSHTKLQLKHPIYSVTSNSQFIACGTNEDIVVWDTSNLNKPMIRLCESHNSDVTSLQLTEANDLISCSIDNVLNMFKVQRGTSEEDMIDGAYSSTQPLLACGFINEMVIWARTSINTIELINVEDATCFMNISKVSQSL